MAEYSRWYDKYSDLKSLMKLLEQLDEYSLELIAQDFIQIITGKYQNEFDKVIKKLSDNAPPDYKRWYDRNYNLHTCIEFIKTIENEEERMEIINSFITALLSFASGYENG